MPRAETYQLSTHAVLRALERTQLSPGQLLDRIDLNAVAWLPARMPVGHRHALVYCAQSECYVVAILQVADRKLKTVLALSQWENTYWTLADIWLTLARHAAVQELLPHLSVPPSADAVEPTLTAPIPPTPPKEALDIRLVAKLDGPKGPQYHTLLERTETQWVTLTGSAPAERRRIQPGFLTKLTQRLLGVNAFADLIRQRLQRQSCLVVESDCVLLVFGPVKYPTAFLPQIDIGKQLPEMFARLEHQDEMRKIRKLRKEQHLRAKREERLRQPSMDEMLLSKNKDLLDLLMQSETMD